MKIVAETNSDEYSTQCVRCGMGLAITIGSKSAALYKGLSVRPLKHWFGIVKLGFLWKSGSLQTRAQQELSRQVHRMLTAAG